METTGVSGENWSIWWKNGSIFKKTEYMETTGVSGENRSIWEKTGIFFSRYSRCLHILCFL
jgi:hypothetical protein